MATKYDDDFYDQYEWKEIQRDNSPPYDQLTDKSTGRFVPNNLADRYSNDLYPNDDSDDILNE